MTRLQTELNRLYRPRHQVPGPADGAPVRAMVLELTGPPEWETLSSAWRGVQAELALPAPGIAVSGTDALQLWFSLAEPVAPGRARAFLEGLRRRFLGDVDTRRVRLLTDAAPVPAEQPRSGNWSAFVAPDLAPVFAETPWLDIAPNEEGQAALLGALEVTKPAAFEAALRALGPAEEGLARAAAEAVATPELRAHPVPAPADADPRRFLQQVMQDERAPLALRVEAARVLLQHAGDR